MLFWSRGDTVRKTLYCSKEEATVRAVKMFWISSELLSVLSGSRYEIPCLWQQRIKRIMKSHIISVSPDHFRNRQHLDSNLISDLSNYTLRQLIFCPAANAIIVSIQLLFPLLMNMIRTEFQLFARSEPLPRLWSQHFLIDFPNTVFLLSLFPQKHLVVPVQLFPIAGWRLSSPRWTHWSQHDFITVYLLTRVFLIYFFHPAAQPSKTGLNVGYLSARIDYVKPVQMWFFILFF